MIDLTVRFKPGQVFVWSSPTFHETYCMLISKRRGEIWSALFWRKDGAIFSDCIAETELFITNMWIFLAEIKE